MKNFYRYIILALVVFVFSCKYECTDPDPTQDPNNITLTLEDFSTTIDENPNTGMLLANMAAKVSDDTYSIVYELQNQSVEGAMTIDANGRLTVNDWKIFDYETNPTITAECVANAGEQIQTSKITINIDNVEEFVTQWKITTAGQMIELKKTPDTDYPPEYNFMIDWGDETIELNKYTHTYTSAGDYEVTIIGEYPGFSFKGQDAFETVLAWGEHEWKTMFDMFNSCVNFEKIEAVDTPNLSQCTNMQGTFYKAYIFNDPTINDWNVSNVTNMHGMFRFALSFNQSLNKWDVSNVEDMGYMFSKDQITHTDHPLPSTPSAFNGDIYGWKPSKVKNMDLMFYGCHAFEGKRIGEWPVSSVTQMDKMFYDTKLFNQDLKSWILNPSLSYIQFANNSILQCSNLPNPLDDTATGCNY